MKPEVRELSAPHYSTLPRDREQRLVAGTRVLGGTLEVCEELAQGGTAVVYRAIDHGRGGQEVALKVMTAEADRAETRARFENEARLGASLAGHPNIARPLRVGRLDAPRAFAGRTFLLTELVRGVSLDMVMGRNPSGLPVARACSLARDVARALVDLHERGIVHRDIKPGNVLVDDARGDAKLGDFGLAYATGQGREEKSPDLTADGHTPGTPLYMPPEALAHERPTPAFDVFSLGVTLYELLAGDPPYANLAMGALVAHKCDPDRVPYPLTSLRPELPADIAALVRQCMAYEPEGRPSVAEVLATLDRTLGRPQPPVPVVPTAKRRRLVPVAGMGAVVLVAGLLWAGRSRGGEDSSVRAPSPEPTAVSHPPTHDDPSPASAESVGHPPALASVAAPQAPAEALAPESPPPPETKSAPRPRARKPRRPAKAPRPAPEPEPVADDSACERVRDEALQAAMGERWTRVLRLTTDAECWNEGHDADRQKLRTWAFLETEQFAKCAAEGRGAEDRLVVRWAIICNQRVDAQ